MNKRTPRGIRDECPDVTPQGNFFSDAQHFRFTSRSAPR